MEQNVNRVVQQKILKSLTVLRPVINAGGKKKMLHKEPERIQPSQKRSESNGEPIMRRMRTQDKTRKLGCPFPLCVTSELGTKYVDDRLFKKFRKIEEKKAQTKR